MNPFPQDRSVLILDNCAIHKSELLVEAVEQKGTHHMYYLPPNLCLQVILGCIVRFLPPYSPDFNPIEESFSCGMDRLNIFAFIL